MISLTEFTKKLGRKLANDENMIGNVIDEIDEGITMTEFTKMMRKAKRQGVNLNSISGTQLMFYLYNTMPKQDFIAVSKKVEDIDPKDMKKMKTPVSCGYDGDDYDYGCGRPSRRSSRRSYGCGYSNDDDYHC